MSKTTKFTKDILIGHNWGLPIYLRAPSWDCGWYWGFGYLGNKSCHYHVDGLKTEGGTTMGLFDAFKGHFGKSLKILDSDLWLLCELFETFYALKRTAEVLGRGGAHMTNNPLAGMIKNEDEVERINDKIMPLIFDQIHDVLGRYDKKVKAYKKVLHSVRLWSEIPSDRTVSLIFTLGLSFDDLDNLNNLQPKDGRISKEDMSLLHTKYYKAYHSHRKAAKSAE